LICIVWDKPNGIVLVTGPTGSGKTTTLYACLNAVNDVAMKIITTEDPVEYELEGIIQCPINSNIGVTYAACLRSILRQDPDKILVGEIRDRETADIAIEASLTGHLVFSTLHTQDAPSTVARLIEMGVEPFLLAATLEAVVAQRLVRTICNKCKSPYTPTEEELYEIQLTPDQVDEREFYFGTGCDDCKTTGFKGRTALYEIMILNRVIRELIIDKKSTEVLRSSAREQGMFALRDAGLLKIYDGLTTIEEVMRETLGTD
jgi:type IV pilus assembly protein PilB